MVPVECIVRGYLTGLGLVEYEKTGQVSGVDLPPGMREADRLTPPIFTPTTKAAVGEHDEFITYADVVDQEGEQTAAELRQKTIEVYERGADIARARGIIIADTKLEFGRASDGGLILADEVLTPDSSRFWALDSWEPGRPQHSLDKQMVRDWATGTGWDKTPPGPEIPPEVVEATRERYIGVYEKITGQRF
jgi:phosphoribosylaminoimidazole-succinocarboxamide synthase